MVNMLGKVPDKRSVDKLECWVWDRVLNECNAGAVFGNAHGHGCCLSSQRGKRCHQNCWAGALVANLLAALRVARLRVASRYPPRWACRVLRMLPPKWLQGVSDPSSPLVYRIREACSARFPVNWVWRVHCLRVSWSLWCVCWQGETRQKEDVWHGSESTGTPACVVAHKCSGWDGAEIPGPASIHVACDVV